MKGNLSPLEINYLLHLYCITGDYPFPSPAISDARNRFYDANLVVFFEDGFENLKLTAKGLKLVEMLCATPLPVNVYVDPREEIKS